MVVSALKIIVPFTLQHQTKCTAYIYLGCVHEYSLSMGFNMFANR